jgi:hypothetical protein
MKPLCDQDSVAPHQRRTNHGYAVTLCLDKAADIEDTGH